MNISTGTSDAARITESARRMNEIQQMMTDKSLDLSKKLIQINAEQKVEQGKNEHGPGSLIDFRA